MISQTNLKATIEEAMTKIIDLGLAGNLTKLICHDDQIIMYFRRNQKFCEFTISVHKKWSLFMFDYREKTKQDNNKVLKNVSKVLKRISKYLDGGNNG